MNARRLLIAAALAATPALALATGEMAGDPAASAQSYPDVTASSASAAGVTPAGGAGSTSGTAAGAGSTMADEVRGTVDSVDATRRRITINDDQGNLVSYDLAPGALIKVGARDSSLSALSNGDSVSIGVSDADPSQATSVRINTTP